MAHMEAAMLPRPVAMAHLPVVIALLVGTAHQEVGMVPPTVAMAMAIVAMAVGTDVQTVTAPQEEALLLEAVATVATMPPTVAATKTVRASPSPSS